MDYDFISLAAFTITQKAFLATIILGIASGMLGAFVVVRREALVGDALSHAVLPGVVLGCIMCHILEIDRNPWVIFTCAVLIGLLSAGTVRAIEATTRLKSDAALGIVLASFFGLGLAMQSGLKEFIDNRAGISSFIYGNTSMISDADLSAMFWTTVVLVLVVWLLIRPLLVVSFDQGFAVALGYPVKWLNFIFYTLLTFSVVVSMQAVGVILVSALLITPAATAYLLTDRLCRLMIYAVGFAVASGVIGCYGSLHVESIDIPTGPLIALTAAVIFGLVYLMAPQHGVIAKSLKVLRRRQRINRENTLKAIYKMLENDGFAHDGVGVNDLAQVRKLSQEHVKRDISRLTISKEASWDDERSGVYLTPTGWKRAVEIVRNHRLWELYLTNQADYQADHVHDDAEKIEHVIGASTVRRLERDLDFPALDPHGKPIPSVSQVMAQQGKKVAQKGATGY
ncbi:MAG: metal ABC transporter permease [Rubritalea sp.]|uniref:metal ABC transporter permease n=1 Tax=Rubritalea sp. TaxID=2109375 RepID=UPI003241CA4C